MKVWAVDGAELEVGWIGGPPMVAPTSGSEQEKTAERFLSPVGRKKSTDYGNCKLARESEIGVDKNMVRRRAVLAVGFGEGDDRDSRDSEQTSS